MIQRVDYLKIDVEGSEIKVLEGMKKMLENTEKVAIETHQRKGKMTTKDCLQILKEYGFKTKTKKGTEGTGNTNFIYAKKDNPNIDSLKVGEI